MAYDERIGRRTRFTIDRIEGPGGYLVAQADPGAAPVLLPRRELPAGVGEGDSLDAFVYFDSEDRPIATLAGPKLMLGEVTFLQVVDVAPFGAFVDWGLPKHLLVPKAEQTRDLRRGDREPIGLYVDPSGRLAGTMKIGEMLRQGAFEPDEWVAGEAWREEPGIGLFVLVERTALGLVPAHEPHRLRRGEATRFRVSHVHPDGKIELSVRGHAHEERHDDARRILDVLSRPHPPTVSDRSSPDEIRTLFGLSKKAYKRAVGLLLKQGAVQIDEAGTVTRTR